MTYLPPLPDIRNPNLDLAAALTGLAAEYGADVVYGMIRALRANQNGHTVSTWVGQQIARDIRHAMVEGNLDYGRARYNTAQKWGFTGAALNNWNKIANAGWENTYGTKPEGPGNGVRWM